MEAFGVFVILIYIIRLLRRRVREHSIDNRLKAMAAERGQKYYIDHDGDKILLDGNQPFRYEYLWNDGSTHLMPQSNVANSDVVMVNKISGQIIKNISATERLHTEKTAREWAIAHNRRLYPISTERDVAVSERGVGAGLFRGMMYRDIKTGKRYVLRRGILNSMGVYLLNVDSCSIDGVLFPAGKLPVTLDERGNHESHCKTRIITGIELVEKANDFIKSRPDKFGDPPRMNDGKFVYMKNITRGGLPDLYEDSDAARNMRLDNYDLLYLR